MIIGIGNDIQNIKKVQELTDKYQEKFFRKILTDNEINILNKKEGKKRIEFISGRFSAKEAFSKALGIGLNDGIGWKDIEITKDDKGAPHLNYFGTYKKDEIGNMFVSISHSDLFVTSMVVIEKKEQVK